MYIFFAKVFEISKLLSTYALKLCFLPIYLELVFLITLSPLLAKKYSAETGCATAAEKYFKGESAKQTKPNLKLLYI